MNGHNAGAIRNIKEPCSSSCTRNSEGGFDRARARSTWTSTALVHYRDRLAFEVHGEVQTAMEERMRSK